jgi:hypothetical protein
MNISNNSSHIINLQKKTSRRSLRNGQQDLLIPANPVEISDIDSPKDTHKEQDKPRTKKTKEVQDLSNTSRKTASVSPDRGGDDEVEEVKDKEVEQIQVK